MRQAVRRTRSEMAYVNVSSDVFDFADDRPSSPGGPRSTAGRTHVNKLTLLAMQGFERPTVTRLHKIKAPIVRDAGALAFDDGAAGDGGPVEAAASSGGAGRRLLVSDSKSGKVVLLDGAGLPVATLIDDIAPRGLCRCGAGTAAIVDSSEWVSCVRVMSTSVGRGQLASWGRDLENWTPRGVTCNSSGQLIVTNIHPESSTRLGMFTADGRQVSQFGRSCGPGDNVFRSPISVAADQTSNRVYAVDADSNRVKMFDVRAGHFVGEFGAGDRSSSSTGRRKASASGIDGAADDDSVLERPVDVCCDRLGNAIVCDAGRRRLAMFAQDGRFVCNVVDFRSAESATPRSASATWWRRRVSEVDRCPLPAAVGLSPTGDRMAVAMYDNRAGSLTFRKLIVSSVSPDL